MSIQSLIFLFMKNYQSSKRKEDGLKLAAMEQIMFEDDCDEVNALLGMKGGI